MTNIAPNLVFSVKIGLEKTTKPELARKGS